MIDGKKLEMSQKLAIYELMNAKLKQENIDLEQQLAEKRDEVDSIYYVRDAMSRDLREVKQQLAELRELAQAVVQGRYDCYVDGGLHLEAVSEKDDMDALEAALNNDKDRVGE